MVLGIGTYITPALPFLLTQTMLSFHTFRIRTLTYANQLGTYFLPCLPTEGGSPLDVTYQTQLPFSFFSWTESPSRPCLMTPGYQNASCWIVSPSRLCQMTVPSNYSQSFNYYPMWLRLPYLNWYYYLNPYTKPLSSWIISPSRPCQMTDWSIQLYWILTIERYLLRPILPCYDWCCYFNLDTKPLSSWILSPFRRCQMDDPSNYFWVLLCCVVHISPVVVVVELLRLPSSVQTFVYVALLPGSDVTLMSMHALPFCACCFPFLAANND